MDIGEVCTQKRWHYHDPSLLDLATLDGATQIGSFLFASCRPRWPRQVRKAISCWHCRAKLRQWKHSLSATPLNAKHKNPKFHCSPEQIWAKAFFHACQTGDQSYKTFLYLHKTRLERPARSIHSIVLDPFVCYEEKSFVTLAPCAVFTILYFLHNFWMDPIS